MKRTDRFIDEDGNLRSIPDGDLIMTKKQMDEAKKCIRSIRPVGRIRGM